MTAAIRIDSIDAAVDYVLDKIPGEIVLGIPLAIGKPNPFVNTLYRRIKANPARKLRIITALSLERPVGKSELEQHFLDPLVERVFEDYPDLEYVKDLRGPGLPPNIEVCEFFMKTGDYLGNEPAQQNYISTNYTFVARDMELMGMNVMAQAVAARETEGGLRLSLSSNPDVVLEVMEKFRARKTPIIAVGVINHKMPFMPNTADVSPDFFDVVVTDPAGTHTIFAPPNNKVTAADYAIGLHASSFVEDGGTLQIGIGSLGDAIGQSLIVRDRHGAEYRTILETLCPDGLDGRSLGRFDQGLYGCSEMFVNGFLRLIEAGIIRREVFNDVTLQTLLNSGAIADAKVTPATLKALLDAGRIHSPLTQADLDFLTRFGIFKAGVTLNSDHLVFEGVPLPNDLLASAAQFDADRQDPAGRAAAGRHLHDRGLFHRAARLLRAAAHHAAAGAGAHRHDAHRLHQPAVWQRGSQTRPAGKARFMNTTMIATLLAARWCQRCLRVRPGGQRRGRAVQLCGHGPRAARCAPDHDAARHPRQQGRPAQLHRLQLRARQACCRSAALSR
jgi:hypothetical protein